MCYNNRPSIVIGTWSGVLVPLQGPYVLPESRRHLLTVTRTSLQKECPCPYHTRSGSLLLGRPPKRHPLLASWTGPSGGRGTVPRKCGYAGKVKGSDFGFESPKSTTRAVGPRSVAVSGLTVGPVSTGSCDVGPGRTHLSTETSQRSGPTPHPISVRRPL